MLEIMPYGDTWRHTPFNEIDTDYLQWMLTPASPYSQIQDVADAARLELSRRGEHVSSGAIVKYEYDDSVFSKPVPRRRKSERNKRRLDELSKRPAVGPDILLRMPCGKHKGRAFEEMTDSQLKGIAQWYRENAKGKSEALFDKIAASADRALDKRK
jgi:hypothetical protein